MGSSTLYYRECHTECTALHDAYTYSISTATIREPGTTASYTCRAGYELTAGDFERHCQQTLLWNGTAPTCSYVGCESAWVHQVCYKCRGNVNYCGNGGFWGVLSKQECESFVDGVNYISAHYNPTDSGCARYTCHENTYFTESSRWQMRTSCNTECTNFTLALTENVKVDASVPANISFRTNEIGECFISCFELVGCFIFTYDNNAHMCEIYTSCGTTCTTMADSNVDLYTRNCNIECYELLNTISRSVYTPASRLPGSMAIYECAFGYVHTSGDIERSCQPDLGWNGTEAICSRVNCSTPNSLSNGVVVAINSTFSYNDLIEYVCDAGYELNGIAIQQCHGDGNWSDIPPICEPVNCGSLSPPSNGNVSFPNGTTYQQAAAFVCDSGFALSSTTVVKCIASKSWSPQTPTCEIIDCGAVPHPVKGYVNLSGGISGNTTYGAVATYNCDAGFTLSHSLTRTCSDNSSWSNTAPSCSTMCSELLNSTSTNVYVSERHAGLPIIVAIYECAFGYVHTSGDIERTCQPDLGWNGTEAICSRVNCSTPNSLSNGVVVAINSTFSYNDLIEYVCDAGYELNGISIQQCHGDGNWSDIPPICEPVNCGSLSPPSSGNVSFPNGSTYKQSAAFVCDQGFALSSYDVVSCNASRKWFPQTPTCDVIDCGPVPDQVNGYVNLSGGISGNTTYGAVAIYNCDAGFTLSHSLTRTCSDNSSWSNTAPSCSTMCGELLNSTSTNVYVSERHAGLPVIVAIYECAFGYVHTSGDIERTCQPDLGWNGTEAICSRVNCSTPNSLSNGVVVAINSTFSYNDLIEYVCDAGYELNGISIQQCHGDGNWSDIPPICEPVNCGSLSPPSNGNVSFPNGSTYKQSAAFVCDQGFALSSYDVVSCNASRKWFPQTPTCNVIDCGPVPDQVNGYVNLSGGISGNTTYGAVAIYNCDAGFTLSHSLTRTCSDNSSWSNTAPSCSTMCGELLNSTSTNVYVSERHAGLPIIVAIYECAFGYVHTSGDIERTCQPDLGWNGTEAICSRVNCSTRFSPLNGVVVAVNSTFSYNDLIEYMCDAGYELNGISIQQCHGDGNWSDIPPICEPVNCGSLSPPSNGNVSFPNGSTYKQSAAFVCDQGFALSSYDVVSCNASRKWFPQTPTCDIIDCGPVPDQVNGYVNLSGGISGNTTYGAVATYTCNAGFTKSHFLTRTCSDGSVWSNTAPICHTSISTTPGAPGKLYIMPCICYENKTFTGLTQEEIINLLVKETSIQANSTAKSLNRLRSRTDPRASSTVVGVVAIAIISSIFGLLFLSDIPTLFRHTKAAFTNRMENLYKP
ncbi:SVEP1-like protein [Mya arenaria]|uniref:SVEP1-like protein n=2 Tax=Mya arenaria TaxID=6604 RepID=A0ABY7DVK1_MYAAR|nr:SVEP1-like protein [Mya arenaria]